MTVKLKEGKYYDITYTNSISKETHILKKMLFIRLDEDGSARLYNGGVHRNIYPSAMKKAKPSSAPSSR